MENESPEYRQLSGGSLWVFIARRGWTFLRVEHSDGAQTEHTPLRTRRL